MMNKDSIQVLLNEKHDLLYEWLDVQPLDSWEKGPPEKWTTGQQILHLIQSEKALNNALKFPKWILKYKFGLSNRETRDYHTIIERYKDKLAKAGNVVSPFSSSMGIPSKNEKPEYIQGLQKQQERLTRNLRKWSEKDLDRFILPHPLMGRMPIRELMMWTAYHTEHHTEQLKKSYENL